MIDWLFYNQLQVGHSNDSSTLVGEERSALRLEIAIFATESVAQCKCSRKVRSGSCSNLEGSPVADAEGRRPTSSQQRRSDSQRVNVRRAPPFQPSSVRCPNLEIRFDWTASVAREGRLNRRISSIRVSSPPAAPWPP
jgi:hypothetical protein